MAVVKKLSPSGKIAHLSPCRESLGWLASQKSAAAAWKNCQRGDWMLWLLGSVNTGEPWSDERKPLLACALDCALTARKLWPESQREEIAKAVAVLRKWSKGRATQAEAEQARGNLRAAYAAAAYAATATYAAAAAAYAAAAYATYAARNKALAKCAAIVRKHFPKPPRITPPQAI